MNNYLLLPSLALSAGIYSLIASISQAATIDIGWDASNLANGSTTSWSADTNTYTPDTAVWSGSGTKLIGTSNFANVNDWVNSPDYDLTGSGDSWQDSFGNPTDEDATWELVFRPGSFSGNRHLFNTGGNVFGTAFTIEGSMLHFIFQSSNNNDNRVDLSFDLSTIGPATDFYHIVATSDVDSAAAGTGQLWVNGTSVAGPTTSAATINDWDGGDLASLGSGAENHNIPSDSAYTSAAFTGDIAAFNFYGGEILDQTEVTAAFNNLIPEPSTSILAFIGLISVCLHRQRKTEK